MTALAPSLDGDCAAADLRLAPAPAVDFARFLQAWADAGFGSRTIAELAEITVWERGKVRGHLHAGWAVGWVRPVRGARGRITAWSVDPAFCRIADAYSRHLDTRLREVQQDSHEFRGGRAR